MEYFYSDGGNNRPHFVYRFLLKEVNTAMWEWCERYPLTGPFERWHVIRNHTDGTAFLGDGPETPLIQFESKKAAQMFRIAYSEYIILDKSMYSLDE